MTPRKTTINYGVPLPQEEILTMTDDKKVAYGMDQLSKLLERAEQLGYTFEYDGDNYPEYVHDLWFSFSKNPVLKERAGLIEQNLGHGDTIQLFSDTIQELYGTTFKES